AALADRSDWVKLLQACQVEPDYTGCEQLRSEAYHWSTIEKGQAPLARFDRVKWRSFCLCEPDYTGCEG
ncbi:hypothetical protein, partial [Aerococcus sp. HMSC035B07]|uniref:hypothetical protein n=1 Tax=Aerococcus sp. HMSC035B07 TaxID=1715184 RepID=UPI001AEF52CF